MTLILGDVAGRLRLSLKPGSDFTASVQFQSPPGTPAPWPIGTSAWLRLSVPGSAFERIWPADIADSLMSWSVPSSEVAQVPLNTWAELWLDYATGPPFIWLEGEIQTGCTTGGFGYIAAVPDPTRPGAVAVPVPGPAGPPGTGSSAVTMTGTAAIPLSGHRAVTRQDDGTIIYASADDPDHLHLPIWVTTGAADAGDTASAIAFGELTESSWAWTPGPVFLGLYGALTQVVPTSPDAYFLAQVGSATAPTSLFVDRFPSIQLI